jgi:hypothetical protein
MESNSLMPSIFSRAFAGELMSKYEKRALSNS